MRRQLVVPNPAAGADWRYTIPGQYTAELISATATLTTLANPTLAVDSSPNGRDLTYSQDSHETWGSVGPYAASPNNAVEIAGLASGVVDIAQRAASTDFNTATFTYGAWVFASAATANGEQMFSNDLLDGSAHDRGFRIATSGGATPTVALLWKPTNFAISTGTLTRGAWHYVIVKSDGVNVTFRIDGAAAGVIPGAVAFDAVAYPTEVGGFVNGGLSSCWIGRMSGVFFNNAVLSDAAVDGYRTAAATSAAAYKTAVLADGPLALWMLDEVAVSGSRLASLEITDGTHVLADFPADFATTTGATYTWSWVTAMSGSAQTVTGTVNIVPIPDVLLPSGYTIGTRTPGLSSLDQWSNISVWIDDGSLGPGGPVGPEPYLDRLIVPDYGHAQRT